MVGVDNSLMLGVIGNSLKLVGVGNSLMLIGVGNSLMLFGVGNSLKLVGVGNSLTLISTMGIPEQVVTNFYKCMYGNPGQCLKNIIYENIEPPLTWIRSKNFKE